MRRKKRFLLLTLGLGLLIMQTMPLYAHTLTSQNNAAYEEDEEVTLIVELESAPLLQAARTRSVRNEQSIIAEHNAIRAQIKQEVLPRTRGTLTSTYDYTTVFNGFTITTTYQNLARIKKIDGVKNVFVSSTWSVPDTNTNVGMVKAADFWNATGYHGEGQTIAIIDSGLDLNHEAFQDTLTDTSFTKEKMQSVIDHDDLQAAKAMPGLTASDVYHNAKVPFQFDYADSDNDVSPSEGYESLLEHGTHVAGIAAGYAVNKEGKIKFSGIAPKAQLCIMKVFSENVLDAEDTAIIAALEDCAKLDVDTINLSLGSSGGFANEKDSGFTDILENLENAGIDVIVSTGNSYDAAYKTNDLDLALTSNPDRGVVSSPSVSPNVTAVAAVDNIAERSPYIGISDGKEIRKAGYTSTDIDLTELIPEEKDHIEFAYEYAGLGTIEDFNQAEKAGKSFKNKIAVIKRGEISFSMKVANAKAHGALAAVVFDNVEDERFSMTIDDQEIPACMLLLRDGQQLIDNLKKSTATIIIYRNEGFVLAARGGLPLDFSSLGCTPDLKLKPEIAAPGGDIYSSIPGNDYAYMDGTSMAAPCVSGVSALLRQYLSKNNASLSKKQSQQLMQRMLMSTATPIKNEDGVFYSPRKQGSGTINIQNAINAKAYISIDNQTNARTKLELGDDPKKTGVYDVSFRIHNTSAKTQTYKLQTNVLMDGIEQKQYISQKAYQLKTDEVNIQGSNMISVPAHASKVVYLQIALTKKGKALYEKFPNGDFLEGYVQAIRQDDESKVLSFPFMGFYGSWTTAPILEEASWLNGKPALTYPLQMYSEVQAAKQKKNVLLGTNLYEAKQNEYLADTLTISPNQDGNLDAVTKIVFGQLRGAKETTYTVVDENGKEVFCDTHYNTPKSLYDNEHQLIYPANDEKPYHAAPFKGMDANGKILPDGKYTYKVKAKLDFASTNGNTFDSYEIPLIIDTKKPSLKSLKMIKKDGKLQMQTVVQDENHLMGYCIKDEKGNVLERKALKGEKKKQIVLDVTKYENMKLTIEATDYGDNILHQTVKVQEMNEQFVESIQINHSTAKQTIKVKEQLQLGVTITPSDAKTKLTWNSSNQKVASVDANGLVKGISEGTATITVIADNGMEASVVITVVHEERKTDVESIQINHSTAKQTIKVKEQLQLGVTITPSDAKTKLTWSSSNQKVASVDANGLVKGISEGTTTITVKADNGVYTFLTIKVITDDQQADRPQKPNTPDKPTTGTTSTVQDRKKAEKNKGVQTGDTSQLRMLWMLLGTSIVGGIWCCYRKNMK